MQITVGNLSITFDTYLHTSCTYSIYYNIATDGRYKSFGHSLSQDVLLAKTNREVVSIYLLIEVMIFDYFCYKYASQTEICHHF